MSSPAIRPCPMCRGQQQSLDTRKQRGMPVCRYCRNTGRVRLDVLCACGMPVHEKRDGILYCGNDACYRELEWYLRPNRWDHKQTAIVPIGSRAFPPNTHVHSYTRTHSMAPWVCSCGATL